MRYRIDLRESSPGKRDAIEAEAWWWSEAGLRRLIEVLSAELPAPPTEPPAQERQEPSTEK